MLEQKIQLKCAFCDHSEWRAGNFPNPWKAESYVDSGLYWPCPVCGAFMYPEGYAFDIPEPFAFNYYDAFSRCPNASVCAGIQNYRPACEQVVLTPRCLEAVHDALWGIHTRIERVEKAIAE